MKRTVLPYVLLLLFVLNTAPSIAQTAGSKPRLFDNFPPTISFSETVLSQAFAAAASQPATFSFSADFLFQGTVISNTAKYGSLQTVVIKSAAFADAVFVLSKITAKDNSATYKGRIVNTKYADGYELRKNESGNYELVKFETARQLQDCSL
jgi:hypothetical protein